MIAAALLLTACFGGSSGGGSSNDEGGGGGGGSTFAAEDENTAGRAAFLTTNIASGDPGAFVASLFDGNPALVPAYAQTSGLPAGGLILAAGTAVATVDGETAACATSGTRTQTTTNGTITVVYDDCLSESPGGSGTYANGTMHRTAVEPLDGYTQAWLYEFEDLSTANTTNNDTILNVFNGEYREDTTESGDIRRELSLTTTTELDCKDENATATAIQSLLIEGTAAGGGIMEITVSGTMDGTGDPSLGVAFSIETLEPVRVHSAPGSTPFSGKVLLTDADDAELLLEYVEGGIYVGDTFHTWGEFDSRFRGSLTTDMNCFTFVEELPDTPPADPGDVESQGSLSITGPATSVIGDSFNATGPTFPFVSGSIRSFQWNEARPDFTAMGVGVVFDAGQPVTVELVWESLSDEGPQRYAISCVEGGGPGTGPPGDCDGMALDLDEGAVHFDVTLQPMVAPAPASPITVSGTLFFQ